jgi:hypothetical protein
MKKHLKTSMAIMVMVIAFSVTSCKDETKEKVKEASEAVVEDTKEAAEKVSEEVTEAAKKVAEEVDKITRRVKFATGSNSSRIEGSITGNNYVDYLINVREGQSMNVSMATDNGANYFNIMEPGEEYVAIFNGSTAENQYEGTAAKSGDYRIRVYLMRSAARRGETANYTLEVIVD